MKFPPKFCLLFRHKAIPVAPRHSRLRPFDKMQLEGVPGFEIHFFIAALNFGNY